MIKLTLSTLDAEAFAPFGAVVRAPTEVARTQFPEALANLRPEARASLSTSRSLPVSLPLVSSVMERHRYSTQTFLPLDVARYLVVVAPHSARELPDMRRAHAFAVLGDTGISYAANVWHHPMVVLDRPACFAVVMWRDGSMNDIDTVSLEEEFVIG
jgi:ureidoglycolate lyase